jgi:hypothetical protein
MFPGKNAEVFLGNSVSRCLEGVPRKECRNVPREQCQNVPHHVSRQVQRQECKNAPRQECRSAADEAVHLSSDLCSASSGPTVSVI